MFGMNSTAMIGAGLPMPCTRSRHGRGSARSRVMLRRRAETGASGDPDLCAIDAEEEAR